MAKIDFKITELPNEKNIYGIFMLSSDRTQKTDITTMCELYSNIIGKKASETLPFYVVSQNYNEHTQQFDLFVGSEIKHEELEQLTLPKGTYAECELKMGVFLGRSIGNAKRTFYKNWLPNSDYTAVNLEFELHTEKSLDKKGSIALLFAILKKD